MYAIRSYYGKGPHQAPLVVGVLQPVVKHVVEHLLVAHAIASARLGQQVGRIGHRFHAAGDHDVHAAGDEQVVRQHRASYNFV